MRFRGQASSSKAVAVLKENLVDYQDILTEVEDILLKIRKLKMGTVKNAILTLE